MDFIGGIYNKSEVVVIEGCMQGFIDFIRKIVVMVLILELVIQLQPGKNYELYLKTFVGLFMVYSMISGIMGGFLQGGYDVEWPDFEINWSLEETKEVVEEIEQIDIFVNGIEIEKIDIERIGPLP